MKVKREIYCGDLPLSLERFKKHLRMNEDEFDEDLMLKLKAAFLNAEKYISTYLIASDFTITGKLEMIEVPNLNYVDSVQVDGSDVEYEVNEDTITLDKEQDVVIKCNAGRCNEEDIMQAVMLIAAAMFNNPIDSVEQLPKASQMLLRPYRQWKKLI